MRKIIFQLVLITSPYLGLSQTNCNVTSIYANSTSNAVCIDTAAAVRYCYTNNYPDHPDNFNQPFFTTTAGDYEYSMCAYPDTSSVFTSLYESVQSTMGCTNTYTFGVSLNGIQYDPNSAATFVNTSTGANNINWHQEAASVQNQIGQNMGTDNGGHLNPSGEYHYHNIPSNYFSNTLGISSNSHSPIVGYAADGFPIYYKYAFTNATDTSSGVASLTSGFTLKTGNRPGDGVSAPNGTYDGNYYEDYEYSSANTELDECNGRYGITPDYPYGTYYYVLTDNYPYIPRCFKGTEVDNSFLIGPDIACPASNAAANCAPPVYGCMDPFSTNYNPNANVDDGSCMYTPIRLDENFISKFDVYPNPSSGTITVEVNALGEYNLTIINSLGKICHDVKNTENEVRIQIENLNQGMYIIRFKNEDMFLSKKFFVK